MRGSVDRSILLGRVEFIETRSSLKTGSIYDLIT